MLVNIGKEHRTRDRNETSFNADVMAHIVKIGLRNILMDSHAGVTADKVGAENVEEQSKATALKKLDALMAGDLRTSATREGDPVKREAMRLATNAVNAALKKAGKKADAKVIREKAASVMEKFMVQARKNVEAAKAIDIGDIDLTEN